MRALVADPTGGPENLKVVDMPVPEPKDGETLVKIECSGINFTDVYFRTGLYPAPEMPVRIGSEAAGTVVKSGAGVDLKEGTRVAYAMVRGSHAEYAVVPASKLAVLPDAISFEQGAAVMLQGMTAHYLTRSTFELKPGMTCLLHAAAGGAGLLITQLAKLAGATVIGTVSTEDKAELAKAHGVDHTILYTQSDFVSEVKKLTNNNGVNVVYDSVGATTFQKSLDCLRPRGMMVSFGQSSGPAGQIDVLTLSQKGSLFLTRPSLANYIASSEEVEWRSNELFTWLKEGRLKLHIGKVYQINEAASAYTNLESRKTIGKLLIKP